MPVEIREMVVKATVVDSGCCDGESGDKSREHPVNQQQIVEECVAQVMDILERKLER